MENSSSIHLTKDLRTRSLPLSAPFCKGDVRYLQKKIFLAECRREVEKEESDAEERQNIVYIKLLQKKIAKLKTKLQEYDQQAYETIKDSPNNTDKPVIVKKDNNVEEWLEKLDQNVFDLSKKLDLVQHEAKQKEKQAKEKEDDLKEMIRLCSESTLENNIDINNKTAKWLQMQENCSQKIQLKTDEANFVLERYLKMHQMLLQERMEFQNKLHTLEEALEEQTSELTTLKESCAKGHQFKVSTKMQMNLYRRKSAKSRANNDKVTSHLRAREQHQERQKIMAKSRKLASSSDEGEESQVEKKASAYVEAFARIKRATGVSTIQEVESHSKDQIKSGHQLRNLAEHSEQELQRLVTEEQALNEELQQLAQKMAVESNGDETEVIDEVERKIEEECKKQKTTQDHLDYLDRVQLQVRNGLQHTCNLIASATFKKRTESLEDLSTTELMDFCEKYLGFLVQKLTSQDIEKLLSRQDVVQNNANEMDVKPNQETLATVLPIEVVEADSSDDDKAISRLHLKSQAEKVAGQKSRQKSTKRQFLKL